MISLNSASPDDRLRVYLNDHLAGAAAGIALARRIRDRNTGPVGQTFTELVPDLEDDERTLRRIISALNFPESGLKQKLADVVEKVGRLKLNGQIFGYSLLSKMEELEAMSLGIEGKGKMWSALQTVKDARPELAEFDFEKLGVQAGLQHDRVDALRLEAARDALAATQEEVAQEREPANA
ncbi:MAG TPA: hypothetical protein VMY88_00430 [Acidimicrobiales bacterium]|nr:hypothetical protein [Acidimicrobiales bacterium]